MTRHGKNCTNAAFYSYHERQRDAKESGYGTLHARLSADSIREFDCCALTLQPCRTPVISSQGHIFDRQSILEYILDQKKIIAKKTKEYERQLQREQEAARQAEELEHAKKLELLEQFEGKPVQNTERKRTASDLLSSEPKAKVRATGNESASSNMHGDLAKKLPSFWLPELEPTAEPSKLEKPSQKVLCPISGKPLKLKDLHEVKFTEAPPEASSSAVNAKKIRYICPVTREGLTNSMRCVYLKPSKAVIKYSVIEMMKKAGEELTDPITGDKLDESDMIELVRGGTGFSQTNDVTAKLVRPQLELQ